MPLMDTLSSGNNLYKTSPNDMYQNILSSRPTFSGTANGSAFEFMNKLPPLSQSDDLAQSLKRFSQDHPVSPENRFAANKNSLLQHYKRSEINPSIDSASILQSRILPNPYKVSLTPSTDKKFDDMEEKKLNMAELFRAFYAKNMGLNPDLSHDLNRNLFSQFHTPFDPLPAASLPRFNIEASNLYSASSSKDESTEKNLTSSSYKIPPEVYAQGCHGKSSEHLNKTEDIQTNGDEHKSEVAQECKKSLLPHKLRLKKFGTFARNQSDDNEALRKLPARKRRLSDGDVKEVLMDGKRKRFLLEPEHWEEKILSPTSSESIKGSYFIDLQKCAVAALQKQVQI